MSAKEETPHAQLSRDHDLVDVILEDHVLTKTLYQKIQENTKNKRQDDEDVFDELKWSIAKHAVAEELIFYPLMEEYMGNEGQELAEESRADHEEVKMAMKKINRLSLSDCKADLDKMMADLIEHMGKEETQDLVKIREQVSKDKLVEAAKKFEMCKEFAEQVGDTFDLKSDDLPYDPVNQVMQAPQTALKSAFKTFLEIDAKKGAGKKGSEAEDGGQYDLRQRDGKGHAVCAEKEDLDLGHGDDEGPQFASHKHTDKSGKNGHSTGADKKSPHKSGSPNSKQRGEKGEDAGDEGTEHHGKRKDEKFEELEPSRKKVHGSKTDSESGASGMEADMDKQ